MDHYERALERLKQGQSRAKDMLLGWLNKVDLARVFRSLLGLFPSGLRDFPDYGESPDRYKFLRRNMIILMVLVTVIPLLLMVIINHHQYQIALKGEVVTPLRGLVNKTKHSFELFLTERLSTVSFIAHAYSYEELANRKTLNRIFRVMKMEFGGFVDLGLIESSGNQVNYVGPYQLEGKNYAEQAWFQEMSVRGSYISDVFLGYRKFPHFVIAVQHVEESGEPWILRATIDTQTLNNVIAAMGLDTVTDAFVLNSSGLFQTNSKFYGKVLEPFPLPVPPISYEPNVLETVDPKGQDILMAYTYFFPSFILIVAKPRGEVLKAWYTLKSELFYLFIVSVAAIFMVIFKLTSLLVTRIQESDQKRVAAYHEMEYTNKLASIGRLAAGVAHEINNPMAIINEKAGLMKDIIEFSPDFPEKEKFTSLADSVIQSVDRSRSITHRLLGFARRMDVNVGVLDLNQLLKEVIGFLDREAFHRNIDLKLQLANDLPGIASDRGQLQQVFLNILNNSFAAVEDGGRVTVTTWEKDLNNVGISIQDDGQGMSEETVKHVFEPFFSTKGEYGTGLGLSITYGIVKKLGGDIQVQSKENQGTTITVFLPKRANQVTEEG